MNIKNLLLSLVQDKSFIVTLLTIIVYTVGMVLSGYIFGILISLLFGYFSTDDLFDKVSEKLIEQINKL